MRTPWLLFILGGCAWLVSSEEKEYVTDEDRQVADDAIKEMNLYCNGAEVAADGFTSLNLKHRKSDLAKTLGGENVILEIGKKAKNSEDVTRVWNEEYGSGWFAGRAKALIAAGIVALFALVFCCMSKCTCCNEEQPTSQFYKIAAVVIIAVVCLGILICAIVAIKGFEEAHKGGKNAQCTSIQFLSTSLSGQKNHEPNFIGILPLLTKLEEADKALDLDDNTGLASEIEDILEKTDEIKFFTDLARETLKLLKDTMALNLRPKNAAGDYMFHDCLLCKLLQEKTQKALDALDASIANKLAMSREELSNQKSKADMHQELDDVRKSIVEKKVSIRDGVKSMLDKESALRKAKEMESLIENVLLSAVIAGVVAAALLGCCAGVSMFRFFKYEMVKDPEGDENPYNEKIFWYAGTTWCYGFCYMVFVLALAGIISAACSLGSGACLLASDLDATTLQQLGPVLGYNESSTQKEQDDLAIMKEVTEKCLRPTDPDSTVQTYLLDILFTREEGQKVTMRQKLQRSEDSSKAVFTHITTQSQGGYSKLEDQADVKSLLDTLQNYMVTQMMLGNGKDIEDDNDNGLGDARLHDDLKKVLNCSMACQDKLIGDGMGEYSTKTMVGIQSLQTVMTTLGTPTGSAYESCIQKVTCNPALEYRHKAACKGANKYMDFKKNMYEMETYRCDLFETPDSPSTPCDPKNMVCRTTTTTTAAHSAFGRRLDVPAPTPPPAGKLSCEGKCLDSEGKATSMEQKCKLKPFNDYVSAYHGRVDKLVKLIDNSVSGHRPKIKQTIDVLLATHGASRAQEIANSITCNFVSGYYQDMIDGACYQGVWGARRIAQSYVWSAVMTAFLVVTMYAVWCRAKSNHAYWTPDRTKYNQKVKDMAAGRKGNNPEEGEMLLGGTEVTAPTQVGPPKTRFSGDQQDAEEGQNQE